MSSVALASATESNDKAIELLRLKLTSAETEASKLSALLADDDSLMSNTDVQLPGGSTFLTGDDPQAGANCNRKFNTISPVLANFTETDSNHSALISRVCRLEGAVSTFRSTIVRVTHERDRWRQEKLASDEHFTHAEDAFRTEIARLCRDAESDCSRAAEAKEKAEQTSEQLRIDLLKTISSLVYATCSLLYRKSSGLYCYKLS